MFGVAMISTVDNMEFVVRNDLAELKSIFYWYNFIRWTMNSQDSVMVRVTVVKQWAMNTNEYNGFKVLLDKLQVESYWINPYQDDLLKNMPLS